MRGEALYFIGFGEGWRSGRWALKRMDISSREIVDLAELPQEPAQVNGLSVALDESWFLNVVDNSTEQDIMMTENFRSIRRASMGCRFDPKKLSCIRRVNSKRPLAGQAVFERGQNSMRSPSAAAPLYCNLSVLSCVRTGTSTRRAFCYSEREVFDQAVADPLLL